MRLRWAPCCSQRGLRNSRMRGWASAPAFRTSVSLAPAASAGDRAPRGGEAGWNGWGLGGAPNEGFVVGRWGCSAGA